MQRKSYINKHNKYEYKKRNFIKTIKHLILSIIRKLLKKNGFEVFDYRRVVSINNIYSKYIIKKPIIFDVGAHRGETINRFGKIFKKLKLYCFEPSIESFEKLKKFKNTDIHIYNFALSKKKGNSDFYNQVKSSHSSINKLNINSKKTLEALKLLKSNNVDLKKLINKKSKIEIFSGDFFCKKNKIKIIDILKIDTQSHNIEVLQGFRNMINNNRINFIETEINLGNYYNKHETIFNLEKALLSKYRLVGIFSNLGQVGTIKPNAHVYLNKNIFFDEGLMLDLLYANKKFLKKIL